MYGRRAKNAQLAECHWRYFFAKYSKSTWVGLGDVAGIGTLLGVSVGIIGNSESGGRNRVFRCLGVILGGENWTDTLLFSFNLHLLPICLGLRSIVQGHVPRHYLLLAAAERLTSVVRRICLSRSIRAVAAMSVESNRPDIQLNDSNHLPFSFQIHFEN